MRKTIWVTVLLVCLIAAGVFSARKVDAHQTDTSHLDGYTCSVVGSELLCKIRIHNPTWMGQMCPHTVETYRPAREKRFAAPMGCDIWLYFKPVPPQRVWLATLYIRTLGGAVIAQHGMGWSQVAPSTPTPVPPTPTPTPTPPPAQDPYFTGYTCHHFTAITHCTAWMQIPVGYNQEYLGTIESDYFDWGGTKYDAARRLWTLTMYFDPVPCGQFGRLYAMETRTGRLLDELYLVKNCP